MIFNQVHLECIHFMNCSTRTYWTK